MYVCMGCGPVFLSGVLLARIVKQVNPTVLYVNLNERPLTKKSAIQNLEQVRNVYVCMHVCMYVLVCSHGL